jgi:hypothetical protein
LPVIEPWPEPVNGADLLDSICNSVKRYLVLPEGGSECLALWVVHTHSFQCFEHTPSTVPSAVDIDITQQAKRSETDDLRIALQTNNSEALETYLEKYPESQKRSEVLSAIAGLKRSEFKEWALFEIANKRFPLYLKISSIEQIGDRATVRTKSTIDPESQRGKQYPDADYTDDLFVYDCKQLQFANAETTVVSKSGKMLFHYKWADPQYMNLSIGLAINPGTVAYSIRNLLCHEELRAPLVTKKEVAAMNFSSLSSTTAGDGEIFYRLIRNSVSGANEKEVLLVFKMNEDTKVNFSPEVSIPDVPSYRVEIDRALLKCDKNKSRIDKSEYYDASNNLVYLQSMDVSKEIPWRDFEETSPFALLQRIVCKPNEVKK